MQEIDRYSVYGRAFGNRFFIASISLLLIAVTMYWLASRLDSELENAERAQFHLRLAELRSAVILMQASLVAQRDLEGLSKMVGRNPMEWIEEDAGHYLGEKSIRRDEIKPGNWIYDPDLQEIAYLPRGVSKRALLLGLGIDPAQQPDLDESDQGWLRFKVVGLLSNDSSSSSKKKVSGLELKYVGLVE